MKKDPPLSKLSTCRKRRSTGKLRQHFEDAFLIRKTHASLGILSRATSKRKIDVFPTAFDRQHSEAESATNNATFDPQHRSAGARAHAGASILQRFFGPSTFDLPPSLPRRYGSISITHFKGAWKSFKMSNVTRNNSKLST